MAKSVKLDSKCFYINFSLILKKTESRTWSGVGSEIKVRESEIL